MEKEIELLSRVAANYLFLGQFEALRASLLSLRKQRPELALAFLRKIVSEGGKIDGVLWSTTCRSPSHLAWLSVLELLEFGPTAPSLPSFDPEILRLKVEFLLLVQVVLFGVSESLQQKPLDSDGGTDSLRILNQILQLGLQRLKKDVANDVELVDVIPSFTEEELRSLRGTFVDHAEIFDALCWNISRQIQFAEPHVSELAITVRNEAEEGVDSPHEGLEALAWIPREVQMAHLCALKESLKAGDAHGAIPHLRFLHFGYGVEETEYKMALEELIKMCWSHVSTYGELWQDIRNKVKSMYIEALSSNCIQVVQMIQAIQDGVLAEEIERHRVSDNLIPLPIQKYLKTLTVNEVSSLESESAPIRSCIRDLYHYARISGTHVLECVMDTALSAVKREQLQEASIVLSLFPLLQPLVAVLGWDLLSGKTPVRRKLMQLLWTSKSHVSRLEEYSLYRKQSDEVSCVEYLCDLLCFHLDLSYFVACVNSGRPWNSKVSLTSPRKEYGMDEKDTAELDPFVENFILERLAVQSPMRVLFDVVPGIRFQDAIELISLQPVDSTSAAWKRMQDIELMHMRYALESTVLALGSMEKCVGDETENQFCMAMLLLKDLRSHIEAITNGPRKVLMVSIITSLLLMDILSADLLYSVSSAYYSVSTEHPDFTTYEGGNKSVISFTGCLLDILHRNLPAVVPELEHTFNSSLASAVRQALEWRLSNIKQFIEDWEWRLSILQRLEPLSEHPWSWREALVILRAAPSKLLNLCMQRAKYDIGEEAVHRFSLPPEDKAALELAEWVAGAFKKASVEGAVARVAEGIPGAVQEIDFASLRAQLGPLAAILLCIDVAATSARSLDMCKLLLDQARGMLSEIYPGRSPMIGPFYWDQIQEVAVISVTRRVLKRLHDLLEQEKAPTLQEILVDEMTSRLSTEPIRQGQRQRALVILHQMIDDAHKGKRQFLSGKLHNLARAVVDEDSDSNYSRGDDKKVFLTSEKGAILGLGLRALRTTYTNPVHAESSAVFPGYDMKDSGKRFRGPLTSRPSTYLSSFIIYIATIGDIVDGIDTTHDFNFFSLVYEWPKDLLTRLVFERGSTDAAGKVAEVMCVDFVHEVISACVPPVFPPRSGHGWACIPVLPASSRLSSDKTLFNKSSSYDSSSASSGAPLYPLQLDIVKHLAKLSPVRAVLACVFGSSILSTGNESSASTSLNDSLVQSPDAERLFYEFALDQSERFPTLNRWIQMQSNLHRVSETAIAAQSDAGVSVVKPEEKVPLKRSREVESDAELEIDDNVVSSHITSTLGDLNTQGHATSDTWQDSPKHENTEPDPTVFLSFDWENEGPYEKAVERLVNEGKLMDALALSDRCLRNGASDCLLQLLIEQGEENNTTTGQPHGYGTRSFGSTSWQYCLRLKDKQLAAKLALKYLHRWELSAAMDVLTMCTCHLPQSDPIRNEVLQMKQALQRYNHILCADDNYTNWQEVEADCKEDPEGLALRLAGKGAVSAALEVADSACLSIDLRRELQGRQLVKLLTADPLSGGGPAEASRFLSSLRDSNDALPVAVGAMKLLPDLRSKQLLVHFFLKRRVASLSETELERLNSWALGLRVLALLPLPSQQRCSSLHENPHLILEVLLMMKQLQSASMILKEFPSLRDSNLILTYAAKAIAVNITAAPREPRISTSSSRPKPKPKSGTSRSNFTHSINNLQKEARRAFSWTSRDNGSKTAPKDVYRKRKSSGLMQSERVSWEAMAGIQEERVSIYSPDGQERLPFVPISEEWILTGDPNKDNAVRSSHRYETSPDITLFKALLSLCADELVSAKGALELCITQMKNVLSSQHLLLNASMETVGQAYHATETYVQSLAYAKSQLRKLAGNSDLSSNSERRRDADDSCAESGSSGVSNQYPDELSELGVQADMWLGRAELLQSLLGSGIVASVDDIADKESSSRLRDRLIEDERYSMAVYTCKKCKIDAFPVWNAWSRALIRMEHYAQARVKFKQALQLHKGDPAPAVLEIINTVEGGPPVDVSAVRSLYDHLAKSAPTIMDDSLSADAYLNVLYMPSTFPRSERSRLFHEYTNNPSPSSSPNIEDGPRSNLDNVRYAECVYYLQEYARPQMLGFMFKHGHYADACLLFFPPTGVPSPPQPSSHGATTSSSPQRPDPLATDYGTIDDLCDYCIGYGAMPILEDVISAKYASSVAQDVSVSYTAAALSRICNYCETHRHFNYLYKFQVIKRDHVAAGLCCIQLFMNSFSQEEAVKHLENAKIHFDEGLSARHRIGEPTKLSKAVRGKGASEKLTEEGLVKFSARVAIQVDVVKSLNDSDGPQWRHSLFGNPNDPETFRRRSEVAEMLAEKHFDLAFQVIYEFNLPAVDIYAGVAASLAERKRGGQLTEFLRNIKGTIDEDDWDQVLSAAINVYANKHKERPDRLIDMLISSHRKVLACVVCGRLKSAFQIASRSGSVADVQYVAHQALHANALPVLDMCKQWLLQYMSQST